MRNPHKEKELKSLILEGFCPKCHSTHLKYNEHLKNREFTFTCYECAWNDMYTLKDFINVTNNWFDN